METNKKALKVIELFNNANSFKASIDLIKDINRSVLFENGKQWRMDEDIKEYPKITLNIIKQIGKAKKSNVMQNEYSYLVNSTNFASVRKIQDFLKHLASKTNLRMKDLKALNDDYTKGTAIGYFFWDAEKRGFLRKSGGDMRYELIDIRNFAVANPYNQSLQDQEWVIYVSREKVGALKKKYGEDKNIVPDGNSYTSGTEVEPIVDDIENELVSVYTKFYRNFEGQVFFDIVTETEILKESQPLNPFYEGSTEEEPDTTLLFDTENPRDNRSSYIWSLYPFAKLCLNERDNCFYGLPITLEYIESQKSINNHFSIYDKALQDNVLGGWVYRKGVLDENEILAENGNMIGLDLLPNEDIKSVFGRMPVANVPADSHNYSSRLIEMSRTVAGVSNVTIGMSDFSGQSGKQTQMLLDRAKENSSDTAMTFNEFKREQALIMFMFAKFFYDNEDFVVIDHGFQEDTTRAYIGNDAFKGNEYLADDVYIDIKVGAGASFSEYTNIELLGMMVQTGNAPFEAYISQLPDGYISNKQELLKIAQDNSLKQLQMMKEELEQTKMVMKQMAEAYKDMQKDRKNIDVVIAENERLKSMMADISANAIRRVQESSNEKADMVDEMRNILNIINKQKTENA